MFSSFFSTAPPVDPKAQNFFPVSSSYQPSELFGELEPKDTEWACPGGFSVETQIFYHILEDGTSVMFQVIHSAVGVWYPTIQFTAKIYNPNTKESTWKSINVSNFVTPPPGLDKRSSKADQFSFTFIPGKGPDTPDKYKIEASVDAELQISLEVTRPHSVPGFKVGKSPKGGFSYFGPDPNNAEGYVVHRFLPRTYCKGLVMLKGRVIEAKGPGMFVHAIQGMRPNLVASRWNFLNFQSDEKQGVSAIQMEFTTIDAYGKHGAGSGFVTVNVGSLVIGDKLVAVTAETKWPGEAQAADAAVISRASHPKTTHDPDTGYNAPTELAFEWKAPSVCPGTIGDVTGKITIDVGNPDNSKGLIEKVDVLAEIPYVIKTMVNYVAGTKPYIYQWLNNGYLELTGPDAILPGLSQGLRVEGRVYNEATFIS